MVWRVFIYQFFSFYSSFPHVLMSKTVLLPDQIFTISGFFSPEECMEYIHWSETLGYDIAPITTSEGFAVMPDIRNNSRVMLDDVPRAEFLWQRIAPHVPAKLLHRPAIGVNERLRFYRYDPGEQFNWHYDGSYRRKNGEMSLLTLMVYLNDDFVGGETCFKLNHADLGRIKTDFDPDYLNRQIAIVPETGMALCFIHPVLHQGATVNQGRKYVLRTDVMYGLAEDGFPDPFW